ncbi:hypothetical protein DIPPA_18599 [Diplonema papillatum]|nr:hypothetical protein DIPPA_18599 [Diplonema papillatum]
MLHRLLRNADTPRTGGEAAPQFARKGLVVGQAPGPSGKAFQGETPRRLAKICGLSEEELWARFDGVNVLSEFPGRQGGRGNGDRFPPGTARDAARDIDFTDRPIVLLLGRHVANAFGVKLEYLETQRLGPDSELIVIPHPSGVNHYWNEPESSALVAATVRRKLRTCGLL